MKKIILLIAISCSGFSAIAQQVNFKNWATFDTPKGAQQITKEQAMAHASAKYNNDTLITNKYKRLHPVNVYKINDIIVSIFLKAQTTDIGESYASSKKANDAYFYGNKTYTSSIRSINGDSVIIINYTFHNVEYSRFDFYHGKYNNAKVVWGILEYDPTDAEEAKNILDKLLSSITFKE